MIAGLWLKIYVNVRTHSSTVRVLVLKAPVNRVRAVHFTINASNQSFNYYIFRNTKSESQLCLLFFLYILYIFYI